jgi:hypothetical protein
MDQLVDAYLDYRSRDSGDGIPLFAPAVSNKDPSLSTAPVLTNVELVDTFCGFVYSHHCLCSHFNWQFGAEHHSKDCHAISTLMKH